MKSKGVWIGSLVAVGTALAAYFSLHKEPYGKLSLTVSSDMSEAGIAMMYESITVSPPHHPRLDDHTRRQFLSFILQTCAIVELPSIQDVHLSSNAAVWRILRANFPESIPWFNDHKLAANGRVSLKELSSRKFQLRL